MLTEILQSVSLRRKALKYGWELKIKLLIFNK